MDRNNMERNSRGKDQFYRMYTDECAGLLQRGDRVRIKEGYFRSGMWGFYIGKHHLEAGNAFVSWGNSVWRDSILAEAIEAYPYTREERIVRAIEDYEEVINSFRSYGVVFDNDDRNILYAILDAGV